jgi:hypothetical protein
MTDQVFVMALPTETLRLGRDIPPWRRDRPYYADDLTDIATHVRSLDRTATDGAGSAARDWRRWDERMNWAVTLLRSRQHDATLSWSPYDAEDVRRIQKDELPRRAGDPSALEVEPPLDPTVFDSVDLARRSFP